MVSFLDVSWDKVTVEPLEKFSASAQPDRFWVSIIKTNFKQMNGMLKSSFSIHT